MNFHIYNLDFISKFDVGSSSIINFDLPIKVKESESFLLNPGDNYFTWLSALWRSLNSESCLDISLSRPSKSQ